MESRIKSLRKKRGLIQEILATELGITQQMLSKYEKDISTIKIDVLKNLAKYFNVTTDYLLGLSDVKRELTGQIRVNEIIDEYKSFNSSIESAYISNSKYLPQMENPEKFLELVNIILHS